MRGLPPPHLEPHSCHVRSDSAGRPSWSTAEAGTPRPAASAWALPAGARFVGGVPLSALGGAPSLEEARAALLGVLRSGGCRLLVGHGLTKDLTALGIDADTDLRDALGVRVYDTMSCGKFQGRGGAARPLAVLAREFLGRGIQQARAHDPQEDAWAAAELYVRHVDYEYMVEYETARIMASLPPRSAEE
ncbi:hypothetical protein TSOC_010842 [Tetrabaena socialis]|uniref:Exonuclease domain-containing protein n=1 Tax=Tetrabaena socialis TaxID=47790 RepID=A0A2J7ZS87_9CHLO|nr:hypothetical protein TSOC_010842 [Tetrabaena socialis]|eukprot:PNH03139.1 hypothetical protein TSOC_010842 [Tetrabaena socialis]